MADIDDIIGYLQSLKRGFDKEEFNVVINVLADIVDNNGIENDEFHTLLKTWLNLSIPITKWISIGICLVPKYQIEARSVQYVLNWLLGNFQNKTSFSRTSFVLDWLTVAMDCDAIDMKTLDTGYEIFFMFLSYEILTPHAIKLVYTLTKPGDVNRRRVLQLIDIAAKRENRVSQLRLLQVLLGLFKSYKPECVPENIPAFSVYTAFRKPNVILQERFKRTQCQNDVTREKERLLWNNGMANKRNPNSDQLIPDMKFVDIGSKQYKHNAPQKNFFDFTDPSSLLQYSLRHEMSRPARLRALLCNDTGCTLLAISDINTHGYLSHDLHHLLTDCFLQTSSHTHLEKQHLLHRLAMFQHTLLQGIPVITRFLAQYLPLWNGKDFFFEILSLVEWISVSSLVHVAYILRPLTRVFYCATSLEQCAILNCFVKLHNNLAYMSTREKQYFMNIEKSENNTKLMSRLSGLIKELSTKSLQVDPEDIRLQWWSLSASERIARVQLQSGCDYGSGSGLPSVLVTALVLLQPEPALLDKLASVIIIYKKLYKEIGKQGALSSKTEDNIVTLKDYYKDLLRCLWLESVLSDRYNGTIFSKLHPQLVEKLNKHSPGVDSALSLNSHLAFLSDRSQVSDFKEADNRMCYDVIVEQAFSNLRQILSKPVKG